jgi:flagellar export protein FliJ
MATFRFRAAAALEARAKQEQAASLVFSQCEALLRGGEARHAEAEQVRQRAVDDDAAAARAGMNAVARDWHRNWITTTSAVVGHLHTEVERLGADAARAKRAWQDARRRRLVLERLRDRAWRRFQVAEHRRDMKTMDELAQVRFGIVAAEQRRTGV